MSELKIFEHEDFGAVRTLTIDNEPWFVGKDVAEVLGYAKPANAIATHVDEDDALKQGITDNLGRTQETTIINESGLYSLVLSSKLPNAKQFKRWVTSEVLPSIRKNGLYATESFAEMAVNDPDWAISVFQKLKEERAEKQRLEMERNLLQEANIEMAPKAEFFDEIIGSKTTVDMSCVAKTLNMNIGRNRLFQFLREQKVLQNDNRPYQMYVDRGWFRILENKYTDIRGDVHVTFKTVAFQKGIDGIRKLLKQNGYQQTFA